ncbi:MAG: hypothetical protein M3Q12_06205 [Pseudomonadota bacterium]|uniref:hypothetical protein n=1 Tax=Polaromonas sp. TaxID=1869339 RepID=UPI0017AF6798|nr:hypothetical protein [Polaromonas sp.]MBA3593658.1 hypothetical protein [Polaromonas sp.]MDQ3271747.1 hypothetical protein [Pseudomonadota bacterium]
MVTTASDVSDLPFGAPPRPLTEDVLQSAEEAVLVSPASAGTLQNEEALPDGEATPAEHRPGRLGRLVGKRPLEAALAAMVAGGLLTALIQLALSRRRR